MSNTKQKPDIQPIVNILTKKEAEIAAKRKQDKPLTPEQQRVEDADVLKEVTLELFRTHNTLGQVLVAALWKNYANRLYAAVGFETLADWAKANFDKEYLDRDYALALARAVEEILSYVHIACVEGKPIVADDVEITVDYLIAKPGLISKLKENAFHVSTLKDNAEKEKIIGAIATKSRAKVDAIRGEQQSKAAKVDIVIQATEKKEDDHTATWVLPHLTEIQRELIKKALGPALVFQQAKIA